MRSAAGCGVSPQMLTATLFGQGMRLAAWLCSGELGFT